MKYKVYWYDKDVEDYRSKHYTYSSQEYEDIDDARMICNQLWSNQTVAVIKDLEGNIVEVVE